MQLDQDKISCDSEMIEKKSDGSEKPRFKNHKLSLTCICIDSQGNCAFTGSKDGSIIKWCLKVKKIVNKVEGISPKKAKENSRLAARRHTKHINCMAISTDDRYLATGGWDKEIRVWSPKDLTWLHSFKQHRQEITALAFRVNHPFLYSGSADKSIMLWSLEDEENLCFVEALYGHESTVTSIDCLRKERVLSSGGRDQSVRMWKIVEQAQTVYQNKHESVDVTRFVDDKTFVSGGEDGSINVWTTLKRTPVCTLKNVHGSSNEEKQNGANSNIKSSCSNPKLCYWINSLATFSLSPTKGETRNSKVTKKRKTGKAEVDVQVTQFNDDDDDSDNSNSEEDGDEAEEKQEQQDTRSGAIALIASGSCDSRIKIWKLIKSGSKYSLDLDKELECPGFVNDLKFSSDGSKLIAACGQEHRFGRWWMLKDAKNFMRVFELNNK